MDLDLDQEIYLYALRFGIQEVSFGSDFERLS